MEKIQKEERKKVKKISYFRLSKTLYKKGLIIKVTFNNNGAHHGQSYVYNHDSLYDKTIKSLETLDVWKNIGAYTSINNIPRWAMMTKLVKRRY
tara:strand:+ start:77 stop:358 length:282 start_codon:yes stop_codon:yes gene_type:complete